MAKEIYRENNGLDYSYPFTRYLVNQCLILFKQFINSCIAFEKCSTIGQTFSEKIFADMVLKVSEW